MLFAILVLLGTTTCITAQNERLENRNYIAVGVLSSPWLSLKSQGNAELTGNDRYEGFSKDLIELVAKQLQIDTPQIKLVNDGKYGMKNSSNGKWSGIIGELIDGTSEISIIDLTVTAARAEVVSFTQPFFTTDYRVLMQSKPQQFRLTRPFTTGVWLYLLVSYVAVSIVLFFVARITNRQEDGDADSSDRSQLTFVSSFWYTWTGAMQQGAHHYPASFSARIVSAIWWFCTLIVICTYIAQMAAILSTDANKQGEIASVSSLASRDDVKLISMDGSTFQYFKNSKLPDEQKIFAKLQANYDSFPKSFNDAVDMVRSGSYAFIGERTAIEYKTQNSPCDFVQDNQIADGVASFGLATKLNSPLIKHLNEAILKLRQSGDIQLLKRKYWAGETKCQNQGPAISQLCDVFIILIAGLAFAIFIAIFEVCCRTKKQATTQNVTMYELLKSNVRLPSRGKKAQNNDYEHNIQNDTEGKTEEA